MIVSVLVHFVDFLAVFNTFMFDFHLVVRCLCKGRLTSSAAADDDNWFSCLITTVTNRQTDRRCYVNRSVAIGWIHAVNEKRRTDLSESGRMSKTEH